MSECAPHEKAARTPTGRIKKSVRQEFQRFASTHPAGKDGHDGWLHCDCELAREIRKREQEMLR